MFKTGCVYLMMGGVRRARCRDVHAAGTTLIVVFKTPMDSPSLKVECENFSTFVTRHRNYYAIYLEIAAILLVLIILST
jgi:hypothetical protein